MLCIRLNQIIDTWVSNIDLTLYSNGGTKHVFQDLTFLGNGIVVLIKLPTMVYF